MSKLAAKTTGTYTLGLGGERAEFRSDEKALRMVVVFSHLHDHHSTTVEMSVPAGRARYRRLLAAGWLPVSE